MKKIYEGAEAEIFLCKINGVKQILKKRKNKNYRESILDKNIIKQRMRKEIKMYDRFNNIGLIAPRVYNTDLDKQEIYMTYFDSKSFKKAISKDKNKIKLLGKDVAKMHNNKLVHGDITLENVLFDEKNNKPIFIDFGLSSVSAKIENYATDVFVFKETLLADFDESYWNLFIAEYFKNIDNKDVEKRLEKVEKRRRNM